MPNTKHNVLVKLTPGQCRALIRYLLGGPIRRRDAQAILLHLEQAARDEDTGVGE